MRKVVVVSGGFDPIHSGHLALLDSAKALGDWLVVALNSDDWLTRKKGQPFMPFKERATVMHALKVVDEVIWFDDADNSAREALKFVKQRYPEDEVLFVNGGDRTKDNIPEMDVPGVQFVFGVGGSTKANSSSWLLDNWRSQRTDRGWGFYEVLKKLDGAKVKVLNVKAGRYLSMQRHAHRSEYWVMIKGRARIYGEGVGHDLQPGVSLRIQRGAWHQLYAFEDTEIVEVQVGAFCEETDIERRVMP